MTPSLVAFLVYLVLVVAIGLVLAARGEGTEDDFFLGGRKLSALTMSLSAVSSGRSAWLVVGASAAAWSAGLSALWLFPGYIVAEALLFTTLGPRLRAESVRSGSLTIPEVLSGIGEGSAATRSLVRRIAGVVTCLFLLTYVSAQLGAGAKTLGGIFPVEGGTWGLLITGGIVLVYTCLGGYRAVVVTDVLQALFMLFGMVALPLLGLAALGGFGELASALRAVDPELCSPMAGGIAALGGLAIGFGSPGNPHILVRHMSLGDPREARTALLVGTFWNVAMAAGALLMGLVGRALYPSGHDLLGDGGRELLYATMASDLSERYLLAGFAGVFLATLFAAVMSTCDSQLLVIASSFVRDFRGARPGPASGRGLGRSRLAVGATLALAVAIGYGEIPLVNDLVLLSWGALGAAFGPALIVGLYGRRTSAVGILAGIASGAGGVMAGWFLWAQPRGKAVTYELALAFLVSLAAVLSLRKRGQAKRPAGPGVTGGSFPGSPGQNPPGAPDTPI